MTVRTVHEVSVIVGASRLLRYGQTLGKTGVRRRGQHSSSPLWSMFRKADVVAR